MMFAGMRVGPVDLLRPCIVFGVFEFVRRRARFRCIGRSRRGMTRQCERRCWEKEGIRRHFVNFRTK